MPSKEKRASDPIGRMSCLTLNKGSNATFGNIGPRITPCVAAQYFATSAAIMGQQLRVRVKRAARKRREKRLKERARQQAKK
jgi:hypothetical protein